jgi:hypothetical protein
MSEKFKLKRTVQCAKCPWKVDTDPYEIPDGYCEIKHRNLQDTIAKENDFGFGRALKIMACHHSKDTGENAEHCVGWLNHQLGRGNNIGLRMSMMRCENIKDLKVVGEQHERFEDTLPDSADW